MILVRKARLSLWSVPVGLQLSAIYALLLALTLALLGYALYAQLDGFLVRNTLERLDRTTQPSLERPFPILRDEGPRGGPDFGLRGEHRGQPDPEQLAASLVHGLSSTDVAVAVLGEAGQVISSTQSIAGRDAPNIPALPADWQDRIASGHAAHWVLPRAGGERRLVVLTPIVVTSPGGAPQMQIYLEEIASLGAADAVLDQLRLYLALGIVVGTVVGVLAGLALTRAVLRPLDRMVSTAEAISAGDLTRRLRLPPGSNEIARLGRAFDHMVGRLASTLEAQRRFVADASHELRTPLTSLEGLSEMLLIGADRGDPGVIQRTTRAMYNELARMGRLVADLLTLSRLDSSTPIAPQSVDVGALLAEVAAQMGPLAEAKGVRLLTGVAGQVAAQAESDRLKQVILNLVDNALRYTPTGGEVSMSALRDKDRALIRVQDTGPGIAPEDLPRIFDRFYRADPSRARATGNSGLGLAIARAIVQGHRGAIAVQSTPGAGALFTVTLPAAQATSPLYAAPGPELEAITSTATATTDKVRV